jgi:hypothetical protein
MNIGQGLPITELLVQMMRRANDERQWLPDRSSRDPEANGSVAAGRLSNIVGLQ